MLEAIFGQLISLVLVLLAGYFALSFFSTKMGQGYGKGLKWIGKTTWKRALYPLLKAGGKRLWNNVVVPVAEWAWNRALRPGLIWIGNSLLNFLAWIGGAIINGGYRILAYFRAPRRPRPRSRP